jgi:hypothetical protein
VIGRNSLFECWSGDARSTFSAPEIKCENQWRLIAPGRLKDEPPSANSLNLGQQPRDAFAVINNEKEQRLSQGRLAETRWRFHRPDGSG